jgi:energy-coupling factor transporter ATP-binding protein EcfA2
MKNFIFINLGTSGSGKSTRLNQMLLFLKSEGFEYEEVLYDEKVVGYHFKDFNTTFIGKWYTKNGLDRFQGLDSTTGIFGSSENITKFIDERLKNHNVFVEGAGVTDSFRFRPPYFYETSKEYIDRAFFLIYSYTHDDKGHEEYQKRIVIRSGKPAGTAMWGKNRAFLRAHEKVGEYFRYIRDFKVENILLSYDEPITKTGELFLDIFDKNLKERFIEYSKENDFSKLNRFENWEEKDSGYSDSLNLF